MWVQLQLCQVCWRKAISFNGDLSLWNVGAVISMYEMFKEAASFNGDLSSWNIGAVDMSSMFEEATSFNRNLSS